jgi:fused signal recognition particle receptor
MGLLHGLSRLKDGLAKTRDSIVRKVQKLAATKSAIDEDLLDQLEEILIGGDVGIETTSIILAGLKRRVKEEKYDSASSLVALLKDEVAAILQPDRGGEERTNDFTVHSKPHVVLVVGVNGVGKTTTIGKLAYGYRQAGYRVLIGAADTFRAAANEQLEIWAERAGVETIRHSQGADPAAVAFDTLRSGLARRMDVMIIDTAGRLHTKTNLMEELKKIKRVLEKQLPGATHEVLLVLDATTGQNGLQQAKHFAAAVGVTGLVITKLDGTAKGGIVLAVGNEMKIPVRFIGVGERIDDLQLFDRRAFVDALFEGNEIESP